MKNLQSRFNRLKQSVSAKSAAVGTSLLAAGNAMAQTLEADVGTAITAAQTTGLSIGGMVVSAVAALVVIGLAIQMVRKL